MKHLTLLLVLAFSLPASPAVAYPTDEGPRTGIRRLPWQASIDAGEARGRATPPGAQWPSERIQLRATGPGRDAWISETTPRDPALQAGLEAILKEARFDAYGVALLDITDPAAPRYAAAGDTHALTPGSVAKLLVATALLDQVARRLPKIEDRERFLRETKVTADDWAMPNSHEVPVVGKDRVVVRAVHRGDTFSLWEWLDHALSPSSNAAGTIVWREATLMKLMGAAYPPAAHDKALFARWTRAEFSKAAFEVVDGPLKSAGIDPEAFKLRLFFTKGGARYLEGLTSRATPRALVQWLLRVEQGRMVDAFSSLELKRLMYLTRRRTRYGHAPELKDSAVFFKSGSLFQCRPEPGFNCRKYQGNRVNVLNSLVEVETPPDAKGRRRIYLIGVMSNELRRNASSDHARLAGAIHRLVVGP